ncbi:MAG: undecaprenyl-diphosphatase UppP [Chloroflexota bacterium]|nr:undecaprenyl-diphosphatase UppP [Chloroflexota bacterium]
MWLLLQAIVLGAVQGLAEFIPISSSAHLIIVPWLFGWDDPFIDSLGFDVALHLGTLVSVLIYFAADWVRYLRAGFNSILRQPLPAQAELAEQEKTNRRLAWFLILGCIPGGLIGVLFESKINDQFHDPLHPENFKTGLLIIAGVMVLLGLILLLAERFAQHKRPLEQLTLKDAVIIGFAQALAIIPGVSRSGSTITAGLAIGLTRDTAARFSFLLGTPIIAGAGAKKILDLVKGGITGDQIGLVVAGFITAAMVGYWCIRFLLAYLRKGKTYVFVGYRWAVALLIVGVVLLRG